jgi:YesN/AraC family two-component response regulator
MQPFYTGSLCAIATDVAFIDMLVALSGYGNHNDVESALAAGFDEHVTKPAELETLEAILARKRAPIEDQCDMSSRTVSVSSAGTVIGRSFFALSRAK